MNCNICENEAEIFDSQGDGYCQSCVDKLIKTGFYNSISQFQGFEDGYHDYPMWTYKVMYRYEKKYSDPIEGCEFVTARNSRMAKKMVEEKYAGKPGLRAFAIRNL